MRNLKRILGAFVFVIVAVLMLPTSVLAKSIEEVISTKELDINSIPITDENSHARVNELVSEMYPRYGIKDCNADYTTCNLVYDWNEVIVENVKMNYIYDPAIKTVVDNIMKKIPANGIKFDLTDIEFINYILNTGEIEDENINFATYSSELKKLIGYKNFVVEPRMGAEEDFYSFQGGTAEFNYNGTIYGFADGIGVYAKYVVYVPNDTEDIAKAIKERLSKFFSVKDVVNTQYTVREYLDYKKESFGKWYDENASYFASEGITKENYVEKRMNEDYYGEDAPCKFLQNALDDFYGIEFSDGHMLQVAVVKDSSKINDNIELITNDASSDVTISTTSKEIPLDTLIKVARLTSGDEYEKIIKLLNVTNSEMFDLKLFSKTSGDYITKLNNGTFEVKIPISENLKNKNLIVYYVTDENKIEEYEVTIKNGYAVFTTNHFSIYTLAENKNNTGNTSLDNKTSSNQTTTNPKTGDNIGTYVITLIISLAGLVSEVIYLRKKKVAKG